MLWKTLGDSLRVSSVSAGRGYSERVLGRLSSSLNIIDINFDKALTVLHLNVHQDGIERQW